MPCDTARETKSVDLAVRVDVRPYASGHAIDLVVHASMVVKALKAQVFKDKGRYYPQRPDRCNDPYLENPTVSFKQGRVHVGAQFAGRIGANSLSRLHIDLLEAVRVLTAPEKTAPYAIAVRDLQLSNLAVQNEELHVTVSGAVEIR